MFSEVASAHNGFAGDKQRRGRRQSGQDTGVGGEKEEEIATPRKIVYTAYMDLVVENFEQVRSQVDELVAQYGGFVADSNFQGSSGSSRSGKWTIRIPVKQYGDFLSAAADLGELESQRTTSREVTEEYYDVEARIRNKQREEERLLKHLEESTGKLEDILNVEREISRVRGELERLQGRMRVLQNLTELTTVTLHIREVKNYVPAQAPTFLTRISRTFDGTLESLLMTGQNLVLVIVASGPWLVILGIPFGLLITLIRRRRLAHRKTVST